MLNVFRLSLVIFTLHICSLTFAGEGGISGGGGTVVACVRADGTYASLYVLDLIEARAFNLTPRTDLAKLNYIESANQILSEVSAEVPQLGGFLSKKVIQFIATAKFSDIYTSPFDVNQDYILLAAACQKGEKPVLRLAALQNFITGELIIDHDIWNHPLFGDFNRTALLLHEAWYAFANLNVTFYVKGSVPVSFYNYTSYYLYEEYKITRHKLSKDVSITTKL